MRRLTCGLFLALLATPAFAVPPVGGYHPGYFSGGPGYFGGGPGLYSPGYFSGNYYGGSPGLYAPGYFSRNYFRPYEAAPSVSYPPSYYTNSVYVYGSGAAGGYLPPEVVNAPPPDNTATVGVHVPDGADVWFNDGPTKQKGERRSFITPPLDPGREYQYEVRARWTEDGKQLDKKRTVYVHANERSDVDFTKPAP